MLLHKPTGKWVGYFPVTSRVTSLAVSDEKLWIGLEDTGYIEYGEYSWQDREVFAPSPLLEVPKSVLLSIPPAQWVSNELSAGELKSRIQEALQVLKNLSQTAPVDPWAEGRDRYEFIQSHIKNFIPVEFKKDSNGNAVVQFLHVKENMEEHDGRYYCGFRFKLPAWSDGDLQWMYALAKTEVEKDFIAQITLSGTIEEDGPSEEEGTTTRRDTVQNYPELHRLLPYSHTLNIYEVAANRLKPGKNYAIWFAVQEKNHPDIAFAMTINSSRGANEFGALPLR